MHDYWGEFFKVALAHLLAVASPGPDFAVVIKQSLTRGRRAALWTSWGIGLAILLHVTYSLLGIGLLVRSSELWFSILKFTGAAYIAWLGFTSLLSRPPSAAGDADLSAVKVRPPETGRNAFITGFLTNALNPKATLFFISLFVILVSPETPKLAQAAYGVWMAAATAIWFSAVSVLFTHPRIRGRFLRHGHWIDRAMGAVFLGLAASLALGRLE